MSRDIVYTILSATNVFLCCLIAYTQIRYYIEYKHKYWAWVKLALGIVGVYWALMYLWITLQRLHVAPEFDPQNFGRIFVLPALTITFALIAAGGLLRWRNHG